MPNETPRASCPLAELNKYIRGIQRAHATPEGLGERLEQGELASVHRFKQAWDASRRQDEVEQATARKPMNAGPLNSHVLALQSLGLMQKLSPHYLRRFLVHVESLQWLDAASEKLQAGQAKPAKAARRNRKK